MKKKLVLASRKSDLAKIQSYAVGQALQSLDPSIQIYYKFSSSWGDRHMDVDLASVDQKGVFTHDLRQQLVRGEVDIVVHSWKDLPIQLPPDTEVVATLPREDMRDFLVVPKKYLDVIKSTSLLKVLCSSPRRAYNLQSFIPKVWPHELSQVIFQPIRGNVPTRLDKLFQGKKGNALVVAKAALDRILSYRREEFAPVQKKVIQLLKDSQWMVLPLCENPCAPAQGALAIEIAQDQDKAFLKELNCPSTHRIVSQERQILSRYGGGCHQKIGVSVLERKYGEIHSVRGLAEGGKKLKQWGLSRKISFTGKVCPCDPKKNIWFKRIPLPVKSLHFDRPLWVSRESALPPHATYHLLWVSGVKTWQKLASRGHWVNGCAESLGEREDPRLESLLGPVNWLKLTHKGALDVKDKETLATYELQPTAQKPNLLGSTHFYWMSGSQFKEAIKCYPQLKNAHHSCGPGHTYESISRVLDVNIFLSLEEWEEAVKQQ